MNIKIEIIKDENNKEEFTFYVNENFLFLDGYVKLTRQPRKRKFETVDSYSRISRQYGYITEEEVPLTEEIKKLAIQKFTESLVCLKWSERNK